MDFIQQLQKQRSEYKYASQARTQAESLKQLSAGIYTEEERFIYELLQNAVDAYIDTDNTMLDVRIEVKDDMLCFMHNGAPFSKLDIEGLCDVGKSNKAQNDSSTNKKKVGYKGIGFKSVFMQSVDYVCVCSGEYCFKFDKLDCFKLMPSFSDAPLDVDDTPWQIIPISCSVPAGFNISKYNVATFIKSKTISELSKKIKSLLQNPQFLLFLNANDINIEFYKNGRREIKAGRRTMNGQIHLLCNDEVVSRWFVHTTEPIPVDSSVRSNLTNDFNTPPKLKEATDYQISFAVSLSPDGKIKEVVDSVLYTFLPTSYKNLGVPFLINANFITDAGRQQLHQHSEWNRLIFASIPKYFLKWMALLAPEHTDYHKILPSIHPKSSDELTEMYAESFKEALKEVAFIPSQRTNKLLKVSDAIYDSINFSSIVGTDTLVAHINRKESTSFNNSSFFECADYHRFEEYGAYCFTASKLNAYFDDKKSSEEISARRCIEIIDYLHELTEHSEDGSKLSSSLESCKFILCDDGAVREPNECYFPTDYSENNNIVVNLINSAVFAHIKSKNLFDWLKELGVKNLSVSRYLEETYCKNNYKITAENAVEVGKIVYEAFVKGQLDNIPSKYLKRLKFLTSKGKLYMADNLYLSQAYNPQIRLDEDIDDDIFVSEKYAEYGDVNTWKFLFLKLGMSENLSLTSQRFEGELAKIIQVPEDRKEEILSIEKTLGDRCLVTYYFQYGYDIEYYPAVLKCSNNLVLKNLFSRIFEQEYKQDCESWYLYYRWHVEEHLERRGDFKKVRVQDLREFLLKYCQLYPTTTGKAHYAHEIILNTDINVSLCGNYMPVLNVSYQPSESWLSVLPFKRDLSLEDILALLSRIADDSETDNKERVYSIYKRIVELGWQNNPAIMEWGKSHKILSTKNGEYFYPKELSYITIEGFKDSHKAYLGKYEKSSREGLLQLLQNFGVKVITNEMIVPQYKNEKQSDELKNLLVRKLDFITLLREYVNDEDTFNTERQKVLSKISNCNFYRCDEILLTYGDQNDVIEKKTFLKDDKIYYVGSLKPTIIEPLVNPLAKLLKVKNASNELFIILITKDRQDLVDYLNDKGYVTDFITPSPTEENSNDDQTGKTCESENLGPRENSRGSISETLDEGTSSVFDKERERQQSEAYISEYSEKVKDFMGSDFSMPNDKIKSEHIISRYRALMYIKQYKSEFVIKSTFDEKEYIRTGGYAPIPLATGKHINVQSAKYGIWYLSPNIWHDIVDEGNYACLCVGNGEQDFMIINGEVDIKKIAESTPNIFMRMTATASMDIMDTIKSVMNPDTIPLCDDIEIKTIYNDRDVHLMLLVHPTPNQDLNSMFTKVFKSEGDFNINDLG